MVMPAVRCVAIVMFMNRNPAIILVMMVFIDADLSRAIRCIVNRPRRNRNANAKCKPEEGEQAQHWTCSVMHTHFSSRYRENEQT